MVYDKAADFLDPIDMAEHLDKIELYLGQVCQIAGISKMQLDYWTNKAQIPTKGKKQRIYDMDALETVMLIKQECSAQKDALECIGLVFERGDHGLVGRSARKRAEQDETVLLEHDSRSLSPLPGDVLADGTGLDRLLCRSRRRLLAETDELRV